MHYTDFNWNGARFLMVDDDYYIHLLMEKVLKRTNAQVIHAYNGEQAVELIKSNAIDLAILDIVMPIKDGYETVNTIKSLQPETICIAYTADALRINKDVCLEAGFDRCLIKPMLPVNLFKVFQEELNKVNYYR